MRFRGRLRRRRRRRTARRAREETRGEVWVVGPWKRCTRRGVVRGCPPGAALRVFWAGTPRRRRGARDGETRGARETQGTNGSRLLRRLFRARARVPRARARVFGDGQVARVDETEASRGAARTSTVPVEVTARRARRRRRIFSDEHEPSRRPLRRDGPHVYPTYSAPSPTSTLRTPRPPYVYPTYFPLPYVYPTSLRPPLRLTLRTSRPPPTSTLLRALPYVYPRMLSLPPLLYLPPRARVPGFARAPSMTT